MRPEDILVPTPSGVCCKPGGFHIDPTRPVEKALITHGHSDHARAGHGAVLATQETLDIMRLRYGENFAGRTQAIRYGERLTLDGVEVSFHPAGHVLGSAQIRVACGGLTIVASGDYKDVPDPTCAPFEVVPCDVFITEATFGLPVFRHHDADGEIAQAAAFGRRCFPSARISSAPIRSARRSASSPCCAPPATTGRSICTARWRRSPAITRAAASTSVTSNWCAAPRRASSPATSSSARRRRWATCGRGVFPIRSSPSPPAGCAYAPAPASAA